MVINSPSNPTGAVLGRDALARIAEVIAGHDCLVVAPDVRPGLAQQVFEALRTIDPELAMASFSRKLGDEGRPARQARLAAFHPASRAGTGALLRFLRSLTLR